MISKRKTEFGRGDRFDFTSIAKGKCDKFYYVKTDFDSNHLNSPKWSLGLGRENCKNVFDETGKIFDKNIPGPAKYNYLKPTGAESPKFSFRKKCENIADKSLTPGPGQYQEKCQINPEGKFPVSKIKNVTKIFFAKSNNDLKRCI
jgi:hypothetical protein